MAAQANIRSLSDPVRTRAVGATPVVVVVAAGAVVVVAAGAVVVVAAGAVVVVAAGAVVVVAAGAVVVVVGLVVNAIALFNTRYMDRALSHHREGQDRRGL